MIHASLQNEVYVIQSLLLPFENFFCVNYKNRKRNAIFKYSLKNSKKKILKGIFLEYAVKSVKFKPNKNSHTAARTQDE